MSNNALLLPSCCWKVEMLGLWSQPNGLELEKVVRHSSKTVGWRRNRTSPGVRPLRVPTYGCTGHLGKGSWLSPACTLLAKPRPSGRVYPGWGSARGLSFSPSAHEGTQATGRPIVLIHLNSRVTLAETLLPAWDCRVIVPLWLGWYRVTRSRVWYTVMVWSQPRAQMVV